MSLVSLDSVDTCMRRIFLKTGSHASQIGLYSLASSVIRTLKFDHPPFTFQVLRHVPTHVFNQARQTSPTGLHPRPTTRILNMSAECQILRQSYPNAAKQRTPSWKCQKFCSLHAWLVQGVWWGGDLLSPPRTMLHRQLWSQRRLTPSMKLLMSLV